MPKHISVHMRFYTEDPDPEQPAGSLGMHLGADRPVDPAPLALEAAKRVIDYWALVTGADEQQVQQVLAEFGEAAGALEVEQT